MDRLRDIRYQEGYEAGYADGKQDAVIHAHWNLVVRFPSGVEWRKCSRCGREINTQDDMDCTKQFPYCHCGAKMDEEAD